MSHHQVEKKNYSGSNNSSQIDSLDHELFDYEIEIDAKINYEKFIWIFLEIAIFTKFYKRI
jgi:acetoin utilization deacetylase AcuC-like enzyme